MDSSERPDFFDQLLAVIVQGKITVLAQQQDVEASGSGDNAEINFSLPPGCYVIKLSNGSSHVYGPVTACVWPTKDEAGGRKLQIRNDIGIDPTAVSSVNAKGKKITSTKTVDKGHKTHRQIGDMNSLTYEIKTPIPQYPTHAINKRFGVQDHPDLGLTIIPSSITVQIEGHEEALSKGDDYLEDVVAADNNRDTGFKVEFSTSQYGDKLANAAMTGNSLIVRYSGKLNDKASTKDGTHNRAHPLIAKDNYNPDPNVAEYADSPSAPASTTVYTYGVHLTKVDSQNKDLKLPGAKFKLYKGKNDSTEVYVKEKTSGMYIVQADSGGSSTITSGPDGVVQIDGLDTAATYILKETKAPDGYKPLTESIEIVIRDEKVEDEDGCDIDDFYFDSKVTHVIEQPRPSDELVGGDHPSEPNGIPDSDSMIGGKPVVRLDRENRLMYELENNKIELDFTLPKTGAMGTAVFSAFGVALVAVSVALVIVRRRKDKQSS